MAGEIRIGGNALLALGVALITAAAAAFAQGEALIDGGKKAFVSEGCYGCHTVGKFGTPIGPDLSYVGVRYPEPYLVRWLRDPASQRPSAHMPALELSEEQVKALAAYLSSLR